MAGNWKMYKTASETKDFFTQFGPLVASTSDRDIVICPTFINLSAAVEATKGSKIEIGGQNLHWAKEGAYTGEISASMLVAVGAKWVLIGSQRAPPDVRRNERDGPQKDSRSA